MPRRRCCRMHAPPQPARGMGEGRARGSCCPGQRPGSRRRWRRRSPRQGRRHGPRRRAPRPEARTPACAAAGSMRPSLEPRSRPARWAPGCARRAARRARRAQAPRLRWPRTQATGRRCGWRTAAPLPGASLQAGRPAAAAPRRDPACCAACRRAAARASAAQMLALPRRPPRAAASRAACAEQASASPVAMRPGSPALQHPPAHLLHPAGRPEGLHRAAHSAQAPVQAGTSCLALARAGVAGLAGTLPRQLRARQGSAQCGRAVQTARRAASALCCPPRWWQPAAKC
jgi:hypothetical protein